MENKWGNEIEREAHRRIKISVWAYAYEIENDSLVSDNKFDKECYKINTSIKTNNKKLDKFFKKHFDPFTGVWIHKHPDLTGIKRIYKKYFQL